jgi:hypothetical protein
MQLSLIVAYAQNRVIGRDNTLTLRISSAQRSGIPSSWDERRGSL